MKNVYLYNDCMELFEYAKAEYDKLSRQVSALERAISTAPPGSLEWSKRGDRVRYYNRIDDQKSFISQAKDYDLIEALAKKKYLQKMLTDARHEKEAIGKYLRAHSEEDRAKALLVQKPHIAAILNPLFRPLDEKLAEWAKADYPSTAGFPENLIHPGPEGKMYRSKSESNIAYSLYRHRVPTRYEWDKNINGVTYHIDFTIRHPKTGETVYWEHCGLMDKDSYAANIGTKIKDYESVGIFPDRNLILTFESKQFPFEIGMADEIVEKWFL